jgi:predicted DNA-binding transcriptional regulator YafY
VILNVDKEVSSYFKRRKIIPNQAIIKELSDGGILVSTKVSYDEEILKIVRYWIPHVKIISPRYLQEKLEADLAEYIKKQ